MYIEIQDMVDYNQIIEGIIYTMHSNRRYIANMVREMVYAKAKKTKKVWVIEGSRVDNMGRLYAQGNIDKVIKEIDSKYDFGYASSYIDRKTFKYIKNLRTYIDMYIQETTKAPIKTSLDCAFSVHNIVTFIYDYIHTDIKRSKDIHIASIHSD